MMKESIGKNLFEPKKYNAFLQGGRWPSKSTDLVLDLIKFSQEYPNDNILFSNRFLCEQINNVTNYLKLRWHIYIEMDYEKLDRRSFIGKFIINGVLLNEKRPKE